MAYEQLTADAIKELHEWRTRAETAETELSSLREAVERHRYNLPHEYKLVDGHTPSAEGCRTCAFLLAWDAAADPSPSPADPKGQS